MKPIRLVEDWILVKPIDEVTGEKKIGSIIVPEQVVKENNSVKKAVVVQISEDVLSGEILVKQARKKGEPIPVVTGSAASYEVGDTILYFEKIGIKYGEYVFLKYDGMLAIEEK